MKDTCRLLIAPAVLLCSVLTQRSLSAGWGSFDQNVGQIERWEKSTVYSTIQGRIDQVNQLLELDYQKRGGARYTALDKWTKQLNSLNQAIVSKLT